MFGTDKRNWLAWRYKILIQLPICYWFSIPIPNRTSHPEQFEVQHVVKGHLDLKLKKPGIEPATCWSRRLCLLSHSRPVAQVITVQIMGEVVLKTFFCLWYFLLMSLCLHGRVLQWLALLLHSRKVQGSSLSLWSLNVLLMAVWVSSRSSSILPQSKDVQVWVNDNSRPSLRVWAWGVRGVVKRWMAEYVLTSVSLSQPVEAPPWVMASPVSVYNSNALDTHISSVSDFGTSVCIEISKSCMRSGWRWFRPVLCIK